MKIRQVKKEDLAAICNIELLTFPPQEAASYETFLYRHIHFPQSFFLAESGDGAIAAFLSGRPVDIADDAGIDDKMYENSLFPEGDAFALLSINTLPDLQGKGFASALITHAIGEAASLGCRRMILACKEEKITFYEQFGFRQQGLSVSEHGGAVWYDMSGDL